VEEVENARRRPRKIVRGAKARLKRPHMVASAGRQDAGATGRWGEPFVPQDEPFVSQDKPFVPQDKPFVPRCGPLVPQGK
jgi:hypothetical protein